MKSLRFAVIIATMMATALHADDLAVSGLRDVTVLLFYEPDISDDYEKAFWLCCGRWLTEPFPMVPFPVN